MLIIILIAGMVMVLFLFIILTLLFFLLRSPSSSSSSSFVTETFISGSPRILTGEEPSIPFSEVQAIFQENLGAVGFLTLDENYNLPNLINVKNFLRYDKTNLYQYVPETVDCDDFARILQGELLKTVAAQNNEDEGNGIAFGTLYGEISLDGIEEPYPHAMNIVITADKDVILLEPQNDAIYYPNEKSTYWVVIM